MWPQNWASLTMMRTGRQLLDEQVKALCDTYGVQQIHLIIEATGGYEAALVAHAYEQNWLVSMPNPKQVRDWAKGVGYRAKTESGRCTDSGALRRSNGGRPHDRRWPPRYRTSIACSSAAMTWSKPFKKNRRACPNRPIVRTFLPRFGRVFSRSLRPWKRRWKKLSRRLENCVRPMNHSSKT